MSKKTAAPAPAPDYVTEIRVGVIALEDLRVYSRNARLHSADQIDQIVASIREFGWTNPLLIDVSDDGLIVAGHGRRAAAHKLYAAGEMIRLPDGRTLPPGTVPFVDCSGWTEEQRRAYTIADNKLAENATWDESLLKLELGELSTAGLDFDIGVIGFSAKERDKILGLSLGEDDGGSNESRASLADRFGIPPFSVMNAREGWWQERKRAWLALGIKSELGRGGDGVSARTFGQDLMRGEHVVGGVRG